jgi:MFS family permease
MAFSSTSTVLPLYLSELGASKLLIGILPGVSAIGGAFPQLFAAWWTGSLRHKKRVLTLLHLPLLVAFAALAVASARIREADVLVRAFYWIFPVIAMGIGLVIPVWGDFLSKVFDPGRRGRAIATAFFVQCVLGGLAGFFLLPWTLRRWDFPVNFAFVFAASAFAGALGSLSFLAFHEPPGGGAGRPRPHAFGREVKAVLFGDRNLRRFLLARFLLSMNLIALAFYAVYGKEKLGFELSAAGTFTGISFFAQGASYLFWGHLGDRHGYKSVILLQYSFALAAAALAILAPSREVFYAVFVLVGFVVAGEAIGLMNFAIDLSPHADRSLYVAIVYSCLAPVSLGLTTLGGRLAEILPTRELLLLSSGGVLAGLAVLLFAVEEPRGEVPEGARARFLKLFRWAGRPTG